MLSSTGKIRPTFSSVECSRLTSSGVFDTFIVFFYQHPNGIASLLHYGLIAEGLDRSEAVERHCNHFREMVGRSWDTLFRSLYRRSAVGIEQVKH